MRNKSISELTELDDYEKALRPEAEATARERQNADGVIPWEQLPEASREILIRCTISHMKRVLANSTKH